MSDHTIALVGMVANVVMAVAAVAGVLAYITWKRQPQWEHARDVASDAHGLAAELFLAIDWALDSAKDAHIALRGETLKLEGGRVSDNADLFNKERGSTMSGAQSLKQRVRALHTVNGRVRGIWGDDAATTLLILEGKATTLITALYLYMEKRMSLSPPEKPYDATSQAWVEYFTGADTAGAKEVRRQIKELESGVQDWARDAGVTAKSGRKIRATMKGLVRRYGPVTSEDEPPIPEPREDDDDE